MIKVAFFHAYPHQYAGAQRVTHTLADRLRRRGMDTVVITPDDGPFVQRLAADGIDTEIVLAPPPWRHYGRALEGSLMVPALAALPAYSLKLATALRRCGVSVLHCNDHRGILLGGGAGRMARLPVVWHLHDAYGPAPLTALGARLATHIVANSLDTRDQLPVLRFAREPARIIYNGVDSPAELPAPSGTVATALCGARIHPNKGIDTLVRAASELASSAPDLQILVAGHVQAGSEEYWKRVQELQHSLGDTNIRFLGHVPDSDALWRQADVYVQPSLVEPFGLGALEAMAIGRPVVASRVGGLRELVEDGRTGILVSPGDSASLARALAELVRDPARAKELGQAAAARAREKFNLEGTVDAFAALYREAVGRA